MRHFRSVVLLFLAAGCHPAPLRHTPSPVQTARISNPATYWNSATIYFLLTDRFNNGNPANDQALGRAQDGANLRSFLGGDIAGIRQKLEAGYFDSLGVDAIWLTPFVEQIHAGVDEGTGKTYGFHGYWTRDWTMVDPALGTEEDLRNMIRVAHRHGIRVLMDAVLNHPGPVTPLDPAWPEDWVRTTPQCTYRDYVTTVTCTLVPTLPDVRTDRNEAVELPPSLVAKWRTEGRLEREQAELDSFFRRTKYPRAPRYYLIKWLTDWVRDLGFDGYRVDTAKHIEETVSAELKREASLAFEEWKRAHPNEAIDNLPFYMVGEVYGFGLGNTRSYNFGDRSVDFFNYGYDALINFGFKAEAAQPMEQVYSRYSTTLHTGPHRGVAILNYLSSHDDGSPFDPERKNPLTAGTLLLLAPGGAQIYYGDELARPLRVEGAQGDANLRSFMNWEDFDRGANGVLDHWRRVGRFRKAHPAVGAGEHRMLQQSPYIFSRTLSFDTVLVAMDLGGGSKTIPVFGMFPDGVEVTDSYSGTGGRVSGGRVTLTTPSGLVLLSRASVER